MTDRFTVRAVVVGLIVIVITGLGTLVYALGTVDLTAEQRGTVLGVLGSVCTLALGGLVGLLAHTASEPPAAAPVDVPPVVVPAPEG